jgi:hypothetical protein
VRGFSLRSCSAEIQETKKLSTTTRKTGLSLSFSIFFVVFPAHFFHKPLRLHLGSLGGGFFVFSGGVFVAFFRGGFLVFLSCFFSFFWAFFGRLADRYFSFFRAFGTPIFGGFFRSCGAVFFVFFSGGFLADFPPFFCDFLACKSHFFDDFLTKNLLFVPPFGGRFFRGLFSLQSSDFFRVLVAEKPLKF